ncbi:MAG TPA: energy transducer TonB [Longimicrobium sp.]|jgi:TonB family protein
MNIKVLVSGALLGFAALPAYGQATEAVPGDSLYDQESVTVLPRLLNVDEFAAALAASYPGGTPDAGVVPSVHVRFIVDVNGTGREFNIIASTDSALHAPALAALSVLRFVPAEVDGRPVNVRVELPIQWQVPAPAPQAPKVDAPPAPEDDIVERMPTLLNAQSLRIAMNREYPEWLKAGEARGTVVVRMRVSTEGVPEQVVVTSSTNPAFNEASLRAIRSVRFRPAALNGRPVAVPVELPLQWEPWPASSGRNPPR